MTFDKTKNKATGNIGEEMASKYLINRGYRILDRNLRVKSGEIDILAQKNNTIVIVEVKTVRGVGFGPAYELVRYKKQEKLKLLARFIESEYPNNTVRIDVVSVDLSAGEPTIEHFENAVN